jgi:hypothetical protein
MVAGITQKRDGRDSVVQGEASAAEVERLCSISARLKTCPEAARPTRAEHRQEYLCYVYRITVGDARGECYGANTRG